MQPTLIFDMDGTLIDTRNSYCKLLIECYKYFTGEEIDYEKDVIPIKQLGGYNNDWDLLTYLFDKNGYNVEYKYLQDFYAERYCNKNYEGYINIEEPILNKDYVENLSKNYNLTIFTGRYRHEAIYTLKLFNMYDYFSQIVSFNEVGENHQKPDSKGVELIKSNVVSDRIYYMGDTVDDMLAAKSGGVIGIGCLPPQDKSDALVQKMKNAGAYEVLYSTVELSTFLEHDKKEKKL